MFLEINERIDIFFLNHCYLFSSKQTKTFGRNEEPFLQIKNNLGWGGCGLTNWF